MEDMLYWDHSVEEIPLALIHNIPFENYPWAYIVTPKVGYLSWFTVQHFKHMFAADYFCQCVFRAVLVYLVRKVTLVPKVSKGRAGKEEDKGFPEKK